MVYGSIKQGILRIFILSCMEIKYLPSQWLNLYTAALGYSSHIHMFPSEYLEVEEFISRFCISSQLTFDDLTDSIILTWN